jgi:glycosyltransferase involved in cell wall biosynthesis
MKIAIVRPFPTVLSSNSYNVQEFGLARALVDSGIDVDIYCAGNVESAKIEVLSERNGHRGRVVRLPYRNVWPSNGILRGLYNILDVYSYDILQTQGFEQITSFIVTLYAARARISSILHEGIYDDSKYGLKINAWNMLFRMTFGWYMRNNVTYCIAKTFMAKDYLIKRGFKRIEVLPIGLDTSAFSKSPNIDWRGRLKILKEQKILLYVGQIERRRNVDFLIRFVDRLVRSGIDACLIVVGQGPEESSCRQLAKDIGVDKRIFFLGKLDQNELPSVYSIADLFLMPSSYEIVGMVMLESLFFGVPVFSTETAGGIDIVKPDFGKLFNSLNIEQWCLAAKEYFGSAGKYSFKKRFSESRFLRSWEDVGKRYVSFYERVDRSRDGD